MPVRLGLLALLVTACSAPAALLAPGAELPADVPTSSTEDGTPTSPGTPACGARVAWISPDDAALRIPVDVPVQAGFDAPVPEGRRWDLRVEGVDGTATLSEDGRVATFTPHAPLLHAASYRVEASACGSAAETSFTTIGHPVDPAALDGRTWVLPLAELEWITPSAPQALLPVVDALAAMLHVRVRDDGPHLQLRLAVDPAFGMWPVPCAPVVDLGRVDLTGNPRFRSDASAVTFSWMGASVRVEDVAVSGVFEADGTQLAEVTLQALLDARGSDALVGVDDLCLLTDEAYDEPCQPCHDGVVACLPAFVTRSKAQASQGDVDFAGSAVEDVLGICR